MPLIEKEDVLQALRKAWVELDYPFDSCIAGIMEFRRRYRNWTPDEKDMFRQSTPEQKQWALVSCMGSKREAKGASRL